jgi:hypothetical protein
VFLPVSDGRVVYRSVISGLLCLLLTAPGSTQLRNEVVVGLAVRAAGLCVKHTNLVQEGLSFALTLKQNSQFAEGLTLVSYLINNAVKVLRVLSLLSVFGEDLLFAQVGVDLLERRHSEDVLDQCRVCLVSNVEEDVLGIETQVNVLRLECGSRRHFHLYIVNRG